MQDFHLAIISTGRPHNVEFMQKLCEPLQCNWFVNDGEYNAYIDAGAYSVYEGAKNICHARNMALNHAFIANMPSIQISDDLRSVKRYSIQEGKRKYEFITVKEVCENMIALLQQHDLLYAGVAVTSNPLNYTGKDIDTNKLIVNDFICMRPTYLEFDENVALKEDYDMCIEQLLLVGGMLRLNNMLCDFPHRQNKGGANTYRTYEVEKLANEALMKKWPKFVQPHRTRDNQVELNYKNIELARMGGLPKNIFE